MHDLVPIVLFISMFGALYGIFYIRSRENLAMLEKGFNPRDEHKHATKSFASLKIGLLLVGAGLGLFTAYMIDHNVLQRPAFDDNPAIYFALTAVGGGLGLVISFFVERKSPDKNKP